MIYEFDDSIIYLKSTLEQKSKVNAGYSMRAFARKLGISAGGLSLILNRKKKLSVTRAHELARALELNHEESEYFMALVQLEGAKSETLRLQCMERLKALNPNINKTQNLKKTLLTLDHFKLISEWYGLAVLELISGAKGEWNAKTIAKKLGLNKIEVDVTLERLVKLELIEEAEGTFKRCVETILVGSQVPNEALRNYYEGVHAQSAKSIRTQTPAEKVIGAQVFAFDLTQLEEVRKITNDYLDRLNALGTAGENKTEIYQAIVNVFRLGHKETI